MNPFTYVKANSSEDAIATLTQVPEAMLIAGGTNMLDLMKEGVQTPLQLVDIRKLPAQIELCNDRLYIGAMARNSEVAYHPIVRSRYPVLSEAILAGASAQLRNMATTGGNLMQRTRCSYFHDVAFACNKRQPGSGCAALEGFNRIHAVFGTSDHCIATHPSDMCVALATLDAIVHTRSATGERQIPFADFHRLPGETPHLETVLTPGEMITAIELPALPFAWRLASPSSVGSHYLKVRDRASYAFALVSAAVILDLEGDKIRQAKIAMGGVGTKPWRMPEAEQVLIGSPATDTTFSAAADAALQNASPRQFNHFKVDLAKVTLKETLRIVALKGGES